MKKARRRERHLDAPDAGRLLGRHGRRSGRQSKSCPPSQSRGRRDDENGDLGDRLDRY
jgi:hypothetical protein